MGERTTPTSGRRPSPRFLIVRTSAMGDVVHTLPLATALRRRWPRAHIAWVVERPFAPLLAGHPAVDELLEVELRRWRRRPFSAATLRAVAGFVRALDAQRADVAIDAMGNHKGALIAALSRAGRTLGPRAADRRERSSAAWIDETVALAGDHVVERQRSLAAAAGAAGTEIDFGAAGIGAAAEATSSAPSVLIHPGAGWRNKEYPADRWAAVARGLVARGLATPSEGGIGVLAGPGEGELAAAVVERSAGAATAVAGGGIAQLAADLRRARLLLAGDTGPLHLAVALGTPVICLLGPTDPARNGAWGSPQSNVHHPLPCSGCYQRLDEAKACLLEIEPREIVDRAHRLLTG